MLKRSSRSLKLAALLAASANAQTITSTIPVCPTASSTTITLPTTVTFCPGPHCNGGGSGPMITAAPNHGVGQPGMHVGEYTSIGPDGKTTVLGIWETVYDSLGEHGLVPATYTITQPCPCDITPHATALPTGFETTVMACSVCGPHSMVTLTQPCTTGPYASQTPSVGQPAPAAVAPANAAPVNAAPAAPGSAQASAGSGASAQAGPNGASAGAGSNADAMASGPGSASAMTGAGAGASAQYEPAGSSAQAGAGADAVAGASAGNVPAGQVAPAAAARPAMGNNSTSPASNGSKPVAPAVQSYVSAASSQATFAGFTIFAGIIAAVLL